MGLFKFKSAYWTLIASLSALNSFGQIALTGTSYTQNFDAIGSGLPTGWSVTTSATASALGTDASSSFVTATTDWNTGTGTAAFRNIASNNIAFSANSATQAGDTNRALGWRPVSAVTRNGAVTLALTNTTGFTNFGLSFDLFTTNDVATSQTYVFEYRIGESGSFTQLGSTYTTSVSGATDFASISYSFISSDLSAVNNQSTAVYFRVRGTATSGTTGLDTIAIDNFSLTYSAIPEPSTTAALGGAAVLGFVAARRRSHSLRSILPANPAT